MSRMFVADLSDGAVVEEIYLVRQKQVRSNRAGVTYLSLDLDDRSGSVNARFWNATEDDVRRFDAGDYLAIKGKAQNFQGQMQIIVHSFNRIDPAMLNIADFIPSTEKDLEQLLSTLKGILDRIKDRDLRALVQAIWMDDALMTGLRRAPAGIRTHHAYLGGLLEHVVNMMTLAERMADLYPGLNLDLLKVGVLMHDIGKIRELSFEQGFSYSTEGQLLGHLAIGMEILQEKLLTAAEIVGLPFPRELELRIKHMILSHHGTYEFGSPRLPMTPEAIALHHLDNLDARLQQFTNAIATDGDPNSSWTAYDANLTRRIYKGAGVE